ncbi:MAG: adenylate/guanylate cyclase domain-containing protein [Gammaproteobacteria bacterium]
MKNIKFSLRISILTLFASLLILICSFIIFNYYHTTDRFLLDSAEKLLLVVSDKIEQEITIFIQPAKQRLSLGSNLIDKKIITPSPSTTFTTFMLQMLKDMPNSSSVFWASPKREFFSVERTLGKDFNLIQLLAGSPYGLVQKIDAKGNYIGQATYQKINFDPSLRPWYDKTLHTKMPTISDVYLFYPFGENQAVLGISMVHPIYDSTNNLTGMLGFDIPLRTLSTFISDLKITPNSFPFIFDNKNNVVAGKPLLTTDQNTLLQVNKMAIPYVENSFYHYQQDKKQLFSYNFGGTTYLAFYDPLEQLQAYNLTSTLAIVMPIKDVIGFVIDQLIHSFTTAITLIIFGIILVWFASSALAKPIIKLAKEARLIKQLELVSDIETNSRIKEIFSMQEAFNSMKQSVQSFVRYVPMALVKNLMSSGGIAHVGGENKTVTFLFTDITGFTSLSENMEPQQMMSYLSEYLEVMTKVILKKNGTVDKYIGDAIMAFWNAPQDDRDHALHACEASILMLEELDKLNQRWKAIGYPELHIRTGICTGNATIGNVGSDDRLSYTAIGDTVNITNRVEELNKIYHSKIIVSESTYRLVQNNFSFRMLDYVLVRGKNRALYIYELILPDHYLTQEQLKSYNMAFHSAFDLYQKGFWPEAITAFEALVTSYPEDQLVKIFLERCYTLQKNPIPEWIGAWRT